MTVAEVGAMLQSIQGFENKVTYYAWKDNQAPQLPFICFFTPSTNNFVADGIVYHSFREFAIELYSKEQDFVSETKIETCLNNAGIVWTKETDYIEDEQCFFTLYEIEV